MNSSTHLIALLFLVSMAPAGAFAEEPELSAEATVELADRHHGRSHHDRHFYRHDGDRHDRYYWRRYPPPPYYYPGPYYYGDDGSGVYYDSGNGFYFYYKN